VRPKRPSSLSWLSIRRKSLRYSKSWTRRSRITRSQSLHWRKSYQPLKKRDKKMKPTTKWDWRSNIWRNLNWRSNWKLKSKRLPSSSKKSLKRKRKSRTKEKLREKRWFSKSTSKPCSSSSNRRPQSSQSKYKSQNRRSPRPLLTAVPPTSIWQSSRRRSNRPKTICPFTWKLPQMPARSRMSNKWVTASSFPRPVKPFNYLQFKSPRLRTAIIRSTLDWTKKIKNDQYQFTYQTCHCFCMTRAILII